MTKIIEIPLDKADWETTKAQNKNLIRTNQIQIIMASKILEMCDEKIKEFEDLEEKAKKEGVKKLVG
jgi:hypothetical protein